jgi:hypothetical protein
MTRRSRKTQQYKSLSSKQFEQRIEKLYNFFEQAEQTQRHFTISDIECEVGYKFNTAESYRTKKWHWFMYPVPGMRGTYYCEGLYQFSKEVFISMHRNKWAIDPDAVTQPRPLNLDKRSLFLLVFLLLITLGWWQVTRRYYIRFWALRIPLAI